MTSSRQVKKGRGADHSRPSVSGSWSSGIAGGARAAAREVGVSRSVATNGTRGYTIYRNGVAVAFVPPLDRVAVRQISLRYISQGEHLAIADLRWSGPSRRAIATTRNPRRKDSSENRPCANG